MDDLSGILVVDKPRGPTSARVVAQVKRALRVKKVGHTGTLDPMATGVLPLCLGRATKIAGYLLADDKAYEGELHLGIETDTLDAEGRVVGENPAAAAAVTRGDLERALIAKLGDSEQRPPMYSALKKDGVRLHELARAGRQVDLPARPIRIAALELVEFAPPRARFRVECSKGTYVRSLVRDLGQALGCGAHLTALRRTRAGRFALADAVAVADLTRERAAAAVISPAAALDHLPAAVAGERLVDKIASGVQLRWSQIAAGAPPGGLVRLLDGGGRLRAMARICDGVVVYDRVFVFP